MKRTDWDKLFADVSREGHMQPMFQMEHASFQRNQRAIMAAAKKYGYTKMPPEHAGKVWFCRLV